MRRVSEITGCPVTRPMIGGPITLFLALDLGAAFAARSALFTLAAIAGQAAHLRELSLLYAPNINSYKRFQAGTFAPMT